MAKAEPRDTELEKLIQRAEEDPSNHEALRRLGEAYQVRQQPGLAADCFGRLADLLAADGLAIRAVPVYKHALKLDSGRIDLNLNLAQQYQQMGLKVDAIAQMQIVCEAYQAQQQLEALLELLTHMLLLDPDNVSLRVRRAELCLELGHQAEGLAELTRAGGYLKRANRIEEYVKIGERILFLDAANLALGRELAQIYLALGETRSALAKLQTCFTQDGQDIETLTLLGQAFEALEQPKQAVKVYKELARIYAEADQSDEEQAQWAKVRALAPDDPQLPKRVRR